MFNSTKMAGAAAALIIGSTAFAADCAGLAKLSLPQTEITVAEALEGSFTTPQKQKVDKLPAFCRVAGVIRPSADSHIEFEVWLPQTGWNGKFQGVGNGGFAGSISYAGLVDAVRAGYASASTDTGHKAGGQDARWALDHPEKVVDFGHRAIHEMTVKGKAITEAFYGGAPKRSYFSSCSNGGRQALMEAQRYPADYDGIIAGAPANYWTTLMINAAYMSKEMMYSQGAYIPASKLPAISQAALAACDAQDGVKDGVIGNPPACRFDPAVLLCKGEENDQCLTAAQLKSLKTIYEGTVDSKGKKLASGYAPGGEQEQGGWGPWITGTAPEKSSMYAFSTNFFKFIVHSKSDWDLRTFNLEGDAKLAMERGAKALNADSPDLTAFRARGGKLLLYHGWSDAAIPGQHVISYYQSVMKKMGASNVESFSRLYMAPGVQHCGAGSGPNVFGQFGVAKETPETNMAAALEQWVEKGSAPGAIVATKFKMNGQPSSGVERTRPLCPYPMVAKYKGSGSTDEAANFVCAK